MTQEIRENLGNVLSGNPREECFKKGEVQVLNIPEKPNEKVGLVTWWSPMLWIYGTDVLGGWGVNSECLHFPACT